MRPEEIRRLGLALDERVRGDVDTPARLELMIKSRRRGRIGGFAIAAAAVIAVFVAGVLLLTREEEPPVVTVPPPTTIPEQQGSLQPLAVEVFVILNESYTVDPSSGACAGTGPLAGFAQGHQLEVQDQLSSAAATSVNLPQGEEITAQDERASFLMPGGQLLGCLFVLPDLGLAIDEYENITVWSGGDPGLISSGMSISGQRVVFSFGEDPRDSGESPSAGVAPEDAAALQADLETLRASAGPGFIVGFVNIDGANSTGPPPSPTQPVCLGVGDYGRLRPGEPVRVESSVGSTVGETVLNGSVFDGHMGCSLWFGLDVPDDLDVYTLQVADHADVSFARSVLEEHSWIVNLWTGANQMQANCVELEPEADPMTCVLLEPLR